MKLYLVRHGAYTNHPLDPGKPLSAKGKEEVRKMAQFLKARGNEVALIVCSPKKRAEQTAHILRDVINPKASLDQKDYLCPNDPAEPMIAELREVREDMMIVGHLPYLPQLILDLTGEDRVAMPTASVVFLERDDESGEWFFEELLTQISIA